MISRAQIAAASARFGASEVQPRLSDRRSDPARRLIDAQDVLERSARTVEHYDRPLHRNAYRSPAKWTTSDCRSKQRFLASAPAEHHPSRASSVQ
jgi:hypothetical protein